MEKPLKIRQYHIKIIPAQSHILINCHSCLDMPLYVSPNITALNQNTYSLFNIDYCISGANGLAIALSLINYLFVSAARFTFLWSKGDNSKKFPNYCTSEMVL